MSLAESSPPNTLCIRCQALDLDKYVAPWRYGTLPVIATVAPDSIRDGCALCSLFSEFLGTIDQTIIDKEVYFMVHHHTEEFWKDGQDWEMVSFSISSNSSDDRNFWLFPMQKPQAPLDHVIYGTGRNVDIRYADMAVAKSWLETCRANHTGEFDRCTPVTLSLKTPLKVIDCQTRWVRPLQMHESYLCLSYVWGKATVDNTFRDSQLPEKVPKTIEDAISVALQLGIPRVWVDQYCIDQKNLEEKLNTIAAMDEIYGGAELTIIGAGGDASSGLPGINGTPRQPQRLIQSRSCSFVAIGDILHEIRSSRWNSRSWTYQEGMLAPRRLIFTETLMYFQCNEMHCLESLDGTLHNPSVSGDYELQFFSGVGSGFSLNAVHGLIKEYFPRQLSFGSDSLNAFEGIMSKFQNTTEETLTKHFYGIPIFHNTKGKAQLLGQFVDGLLWQTSNPVDRVRSESQFPSWTWAAIKAAHSNASNTLLFEYIMKGMRHPKDLKFSIIHRNGKEMDLVEFMSTFRTAPCAEFLPVLNIKTWTTTSRTAGKDKISSPQFLGLPTSTVILDEVPHEDGETIAIYMGAMHVWEEPMCSGALSVSSQENAQSIFADVENDEVHRAVFLLVREVTPKSFRRIGLMYARLGGAPESADEALEEVFKLKGDGKKDSWVYKTLQLV